MLNEYADEDDVGVDSAKTLTDNQIDTIIMGAMQKAMSQTGKSKQTIIKNPKKDAKLDQQINRVKELEKQGKISPEKAAKAAKAAKAEKSGGDSSATSEGISFDKSDAKKVKALLQKAVAGSDFDDSDRKVAAQVIKYLHKYV